MNASTKLYLKTFLLMGTPFGILAMVFDLIEGREFGLLKFLYLSVFFGVFMSAILVSKHRKRIQRIGVQELTKGILSVKQHRVVNAKINIEELLSKLKDDAFFGKMKFNVAENYIELRSDISWYSWGEKIIIRSRSTESNHYEYDLQSSPTLSTTIVDYGKNLNNLNRLEAILSNIA